MADSEQRADPECRAQQAGKPSAAVITIEPAGVRFDVAPGETVFAAATRHGFRWPTVCGGQGTCHTCTLTVLDGVEHLSEIGPWEAEGLQQINATWRGDSRMRRMACQVQISGDVRVGKPGVRKIAPT